MKTLLDLSSKFFDILDMADYRKPETAQSDKQCFQNALCQFLASGKKEDAFSVYFCFSELFKLFGEGYDNTQKLLEMLSDHEYHTGELLSKHRDHYSHSVYVFALGIAFYANDSGFRDNYTRFYGLRDDGRAAFNFLKHWGIIALFHDIGYPYQLAYEQIKNYAVEVWGKGDKSALFVTYGNYDAFVALDDASAARLDGVFPDGAPFKTFNDLLAYGLQVRMGYDRQNVAFLPRDRVVNEPKFMDHGYFSAIILAKKLFARPDFRIDLEVLDVFTAILLHNSFNKYEEKITGRHPVRFEEHPLAYLLIICDEMQCWDRLAYGKVSKLHPIAWDFGLDIRENSVFLCYIYDSYRVDEYKDESSLEIKVVNNKNYSEMADGSFVSKILSFVETPLDIKVSTREVKKEKKTNLYASDNNFICLCDIAKAIHISYNGHCKSLSSDFISEDFGKLDLEFKMSNIEQAKSYGSKLELINCFFSRKDLDYPVVTDFNKVEANYLNNIGFLCREEHVRWVKEKLAMGWSYGTDYSSREERNRKKIHRDIVPYDSLDANERSKDELMINNILALLKKFDSNIKIYNFRTGRKPNLEIAGVGHRFYNDIRDDLKQQVKNLLEQFSKTNHVIVRTCFAFGADQLIAECAAELGITIKADIPMPLEEYIEDVRQDAIAHGHRFGKEEELHMRHLIAQAVVCRVVPDKKQKYAAASEYIVKKCDKLIALWDGVRIPLADKDGNPINRGGTYDCVRMAEGYKKEVITIDCYR